MKTVEYTNAGVTPNIIDKGNWVYVQIVREWASTTSDEIWSEVILTFDKSFSSTDHAKAFMTTKIFKTVLRAVEKNQFTYNQ